MFYAVPALAHTAWESRDVAIEDPRRSLGKSVLLSVLSGILCFPEVIPVALLLCPTFTWHLLPGSLLVF